MAHTYTIPCPGDGGQCQADVRAVVGPDTIRTAFTCQHGTDDAISAYVCRRAEAQHATRGERMGPGRATIDDLNQ